jgi:hypothetical protein
MNAMVCLPWKWKSLRSRKEVRVLHQQELQQVVRGGGADGCVTGGVEAEPEDAVVVSPEQHGQPLKVP